MQDHNSLFFVALCGKLFAEDQEEGNAAIGYRFMRHDGWNPGIGVGLDRRNTASGTNSIKPRSGLSCRRRIGTSASTGCTAQRSRTGFEQRGRGDRVEHFPHPR
jgi:hypothetical protein